METKNDDSDIDNISLVFYVIILFVLDNVLLQNSISISKVCQCQPVLLYKTRTIMSSHRSMYSHYVSTTTIESELRTY